MIEKANIILRGKHQKPILCDVYIKNKKEKLPVVIFCHGYKGFKDWGCWELMGKTFASEGFCFIKFNFSHNGGTVEQPIDFPDLEAFAMNNYIKELDDLETVIDWLHSDTFEYPDAIDKNKIALLGHSRGGGIVTIKASEDKRISHIISLAGVSDYASRFTKGDALEQWKKKNVIYVENKRTKQQMPHYFQFYENFKKNENRLTIQTAVEKLSIPHCIIHGDTDETVTHKEAEQLHKWNAESELFKIEGANHVFGGKHPWENKTLPLHLDTAVSQIISFLEKR